MTRVIPHILLFPLLLLGISTHALAQDSTATKAKITIKSFLQDGTDKQESFQEIQLDDKKKVVLFLDSILGGLGTRLNNTFRSSLNDIEINIGGGSEIDSIFQSLNQLLGQEGFPFQADSIYKDKRVFLGIMVEDHADTPEGNPQHPSILKVIPHSPAEEAGLQQNDLLIRINDKDIYSYDDIITLLSSKNAGDKIQIIYSRDNETKTTTAALRYRNSNDQVWVNMFKKDTLPFSSFSLPKCEKIIVQKSGPRLGIQVKDLDEEARKALKAKKGGALVTYVSKNSCASGMKLAVNDVIVKVNDHNIGNVEELKQVIHNLPMNEEIKLNYIRYGKKKSTKGKITEFSKAWDDNILLNIIDLSSLGNDLGID